MAYPFAKNSFASGELSPLVWGRTDLAKYHTGASTMRNFFVDYRGGALTRPGTAFVGQCKQPGTAAPPRDIRFQFNVNQGYALEFGDNYMRVKSAGAYVTESPLQVTGATNANPCIITVSATGALSATAITSGVFSSYAPGDTVTLAGGVFTEAAELSVTNTKLVGLSLNAPGAGVYAPGDTINLLGGTQTSAPVLSVTTTQVSGATVAAGGSGGTNGTQTVTGTTGTGTKFQASVTIAGGTITAVLSITVGGDYTVNPVVPSAEPVTGAGLSGAELDLSIGVLGFTVSTAGVFTANPVGGAFTQASTSGSGTGATFQSGIFGPNALTIAEAGVYSSHPSNPVSQASTSGSGSGATFNVTWGSPMPYSNGDWVFLNGLGGTTELNGKTFIVANAGTNSFSLTDLFGNPINSTTYDSYTSGGTAARIYTLATPYAAVDLPWLKYTQSADVMTLCCVNQNTGTEYAPYDLARITANDWTLTETTFAASIDPPASVSGSTQASGSWNFQYVVTAVDATTGDESVASAIANVGSATNPAISANTITLTWSAVPGAAYYNVYRADPAYETAVPVGALFGFVGQSLGTQFQDSNITADFTQVPPTHQNPFARGTISGVASSAEGTGYTQATVGYSITTSTGSGAVIVPIVVNGSVGGYLVQNGGVNYEPTDTITITDSGGGTGAHATLTFGPSSGTYPGGAAYFQQRRYYFNTTNTPDTYYASQPGSFTDMDSSIPVSDSDAIIGTPWSQQINGIQAMVPEQSGLVILTGSGAWQLSGGATQTAVTPSDQDATPQAYNGCSPTVPPIPINYDILYVQAKGSIVRDLNYNFFVNIYTGTDKTELSSHLFNGYQILQWAYAEEPFKVVWAIRNDGIVLSLTYLKDEDVAGWARHDTNGIYVSVVSITEPPVDAVYYISQRYIAGANNGAGAWVYYSERANNRLWQYAEDAWCVDVGLSYPQNEPDATLTPSSATGVPTLNQPTLIYGGADYSAETYGTVIDPTGTGATVSLTISGGTVTSVSVGGTLAGYTDPSLIFTDPTGAGGGAQASITSSYLATMIASAGVFENSPGLGAEGDVVRVGGGKATVTEFVSAEEVNVAITSPITAVLQDNAANAIVPVPQVSGAWTIINPTATVTNLDHLDGMSVSILADGNILAPQIVENGSLTLPFEASQIIVGLGFTAQLQTLYADVPGVSPTIQGRRKQIPSVSVRTVASYGLTVGVNQPDASVQPGQTNVPWENMTPVQDTWTAVPGQPTMLVSGDSYAHPGTDQNVKGQVAIQITTPTPAEVVMLVPEYVVGDDPGQ